VFRSLAKSLLVAMVAVALTSATAVAAVVTARYEGLFAYGDDNVVLAEIDRTTNVNNLVQKDTSSAAGDNMRIQIPFRDSKPNNGKSVHASVEWRKNALDCGISGIEVSSGGAGISTSCYVDWQGNGDYESNDVSGDSWWFANPRKYWNGSDGMLRGGIHVCQAQWNADPCSGKRWVTTFWDS
jgi:hypothetical protein